MLSIVVDGLTFYIDDSLKNSSMLKSFGSNPSSGRAVFLLLILTGSASISDGVVTAKQNKNYMKIGSPQSSLFTNQNIKSALAELGVEGGDNKRFFHPVLSKLSIYLKEQRSNHQVFSSLLNEISRAVIEKEKNNHLSAFVHVYRAFECCSFVFPLLFCRYEKEYMKVYQQLKEFFLGGELDFCNNFYRKLLEDDGLSSNKSQIRFRGDYAPDYVSVLYSKVNWDNSKAISKLENEVSVEIEQKNCWDLIVRLRNQYFHHLSGSNASLSSSMIKDSNAFFHPFCDVGLEVLGYMFRRIITVHI